MISNAEIQRYEQFARIRSSRKIGSLDEQNLALMVLNLVEVIDNLCASGLAVGLEYENRRGPFHKGDCTCAHNFECPVHMEPHR